MGASAVKVWAVSVAAWFSTGCVAIVLGLGLERCAGECSGGGLYFAPLIHAAFVPVLACIARSRRWIAVSAFGCVAAIAAATFSGSEPVFIGAMIGSECLWLVAVVVAPWVRPVQEVPDTERTTR